tara:strand:- start:11117 stop:11749 length:633 start_codon:yes stop_codon:yes gene_type:complete
VKKSFLAYAMILALLAFASCGEDSSSENTKTVSEAGREEPRKIRKSTKDKEDLNPVDSPDNAGNQVDETIRPPLPPEVVPPEGRYAEYFNQSLEFTDLHPGRWSQNEDIEEPALLFSAAGAEATILFHGRDQRPFTGWVKAWHSNDGLAVLCRFKNGARHGEMLQWYPNGKLRAQGFYADGKPEDTWYFWDEEGNETDSKKFENGLRVDP